MRLAAIYDIHGNLSALEAVLDEIQKMGVDQIVVGGDVIPGPQPSEVISALMDLTIPTQFIRGNGERETLALLSGESTCIPQQYLETMQWVGQKLSDSQANELRSWPKTAEIELPELGKVLFCHATPWSDSDIFTRLTPESRLASVFASVEAGTVICGHTHMQFERVICGRRVVNSGSVGMPFGSTGAHWLLIGSDVQFRTTHYDLDGASRRIRATNYPQAIQFAEHNLLQVPTEKDMLELFERAAVGADCQENES